MLPMLPTNLINLKFSPTNSQSLQQAGIPYARSPSTKMWGWVIAQRRVGYLSGWTLGRWVPLLNALQFHSCAVAFVCNLLSWPTIGDHSPYWGQCGLSSSLCLVAEGLFFSALFCCTAFFTFTSIMSESVWRHSDNANTSNSKHLLS